MPMITSKMFMNPILKEFKNNNPGFISVVNEEVLGRLKTIMADLISHLNVKLAITSQTTK